MSIPPALLAKVFQFVVRSSQRAFKGSIVIQKATRGKIGGNEVEITRRGSLGADGGISQVVRIFKNGKTEEVWHIVVRAGEIIHKHLLK